MLLSVAQNERKCNKIQTDTRVGKSVLIADHLIMLNRDHQQTIQSCEGVGGVTFLKGSENLKSAFSAGEETVFYYCICDEERGHVQQT